MHGNQHAIPPDILKIYFPTVLVVLLDQFSKLWIKDNFTLFESRDVLGSFLSVLSKKHADFSYSHYLKNEYALERRYSHKTNF